MELITAHILLGVYYKPVLRTLPCIDTFNLYNNHMRLVGISIIPTLQKRKLRPE